MSLLPLAHYEIANKLSRTIFCFTEEKQSIFDPIAHLITLALCRDVFEAQYLKSATDIYGIVMPNRLKSIHLG